MKFLVFCAILALASLTAFAAKKSPSAELSKKGVYETAHKKRDGKKIEVEEEEEEEVAEEEAVAEESEYEDEYYDEGPGFYGGIKLGVDPWKKDAEKRVIKKEPKIPPPPFGFDSEEEEEEEVKKKHKFNEKDGYPEPKFLFPGDIYKEIPFKKPEVPKEIPFAKPEIPKDIYKKEEKEHKIGEEEKHAKVPFFGIPFLFKDEHKTYDPKHYGVEEGEEKKIDPKLFHKEHPYGLDPYIPLHEIPIYVYDPKVLHELMSKDKKFKSKNLEHHKGELHELDLKKEHLASEEKKSISSVYKADASAVKKSMKA